MDEKKTIGEKAAKIENELQGKTAKADDPHSKEYDKAPNWGIEHPKK